MEIKTQVQTKMVGKVKARVSWHLRESPCRVAESKSSDSYCRYACRERVLSLVVISLHVSLQNRLIHLLLHGGHGETGRRDTQELCDNRNPPQEAFLDQFWLESCSWLEC